MGLDTSHDCWHGPYSAFMRFRQRLWQLAMRERDEKAGGRASQAPDLMDTKEYMGKPGAPSLHHFLPVTDPLVWFFDHSDCDGFIAAELTLPMAQRMEDLTKQMSERALYDDIRPALDRFIKGLRLAGARKQKVTFG